ncbi:ABC transporter ATP-binding protein [Bifidobacterium favimelis]|uniref:ABC transporter ATP-binding protein n=1 Tax=Bifidobacterium favimelis TaxID=3122979 RepID=A0ABU8ZN72_9BIFI
MAYIDFESVTKTYGSGESLIKALDQASFSVEQGQMAVVLGASGAGKSTALNILGGMDRATDGRVLVKGRDITSASDKELTDYRRTGTGFVFQYYNLVPNLTALENVELASQVSSHALDPAQILKDVGLGERLDNFPSQLSGGEQQRVAIARALAKNPDLLLCDEPTGALDYQTGKQILSLLQGTCRTRGITVLVITHNSAIAPMADRLIRFRSGRVTEVADNMTPQPVEDIEW